MFISTAILMQATLATMVFASPTATGSALPLNIPLLTNIEIPKVDGPDEPIHLITDSIAGVGLLSTYVRGSLAMVAYLSVNLIF